MAFCKGCEGYIVWMVDTINHRLVPVDGDFGSDDVLRPRTFPDGDLISDGSLTTTPNGGGRAQACQPVPTGQGRYRNHRNSCPRPLSRRTQR